MLKVIPVITGATLVDELDDDELVGKLVVDELVLADELLESIDDVFNDVLSLLVVGSVEVISLEWLSELWEDLLDSPHSQPARAPIVIQPSTNTFNDCFISFPFVCCKPYVYNHTHMYVSMQEFDFNMITNKEKCSFN